MARPRAARTVAKPKPRSLRAVPQGAFDQYLLPIIKKRYA